jgi:DNA-binding LytR/AlgR family response regulator
MRSATTRKVQVKDRPSSERRAVAEAYAVGATSLRLVVKKAGGTMLLPISEIDALEAEGNVVVVRTLDGTYRIRQPLSTLFEQLRDFGFIRVNRGAVARTGAIVSVDKGEFRKAHVVLRGGVRIEIGRTEFNRLRALWQPGLMDLQQLSETLRLIKAEPVVARPFRRTPAVRPAR